MPLSRPDDYSRDARCCHCLLSPGLCACGSIEAMDLPVEFLVIRHSTERFSLSNTGSLAPLLLARCRIVDYAAKGEVFDPSCLRDPEVEYRLLFPHPHAEPLTPAARAAQGRRLCLVVLDGTWPKAKKMARRIPEVSRMLPVSFPRVAAAEPALRKTPSPFSLSTVEALTRAVAALGWPAEAAALRSAVEPVLSSRFHLRGKLRRSDLVATTPRNGR